jgi:hypothetical protein
MDNRNREHYWKFALLTVFVLLITGQMGFFLLKLRSCNASATPNAGCDRLLEAYQDATNNHLSTILALMVGSGAVAAGAAAVTTSKPHGNLPPPEPPPGSPPLVRRHPDEDL